MTHKHIYVFMLYDILWYMIDDFQCQVCSSTQELVRGTDGRALQDGVGFQGQLFPETHGALRDPKIDGTWYQKVD